VSTKCWEVFRLATRDIVLSSATVGGLAPGKESPRARNLSGEYYLL